jgi:hypothetical protein
MFTILAIMGLVLLFTLPIWPYSQRWGGFASALVLFVIVTFVAFMLAGRIVA